MSVTEAAQLAITTITEAEGHDIDASAWETGFLDRSETRRTFTRLTADQLGLTADS